MKKFAVLLLCSVAIMNAAQKHSLPLMQLFENFFAGCPGLKQEADTALQERLAQDIYSGTIATNDHVELAAICCMRSGLILSGGLAEQLNTSMNTHVTERLGKYIRYLSDLVALERCTSFENSQRNDDIMHPILQKFHNLPTDNVALALRLLVAHQTIQSAFQMNAQNDTILKWLSRALDIDRAEEKFLDDARVSEERIGNRLQFFKQESFPQLFAKVDNKNLQDLVDSYLSESSDEESSEE